MPTNPTTKSQVQAYRFLLRRMESALVRKDAVLAHEPMRAHLRASAVGLILGVLGLAASFVVGLFKPTSQVEIGDIVSVKGTTSVFVVVDRPMRLVPVHNLTSARLLYAALSPNRPPPETKFVEESALEGIHRTPVTGLPDAPDTLPRPENLVTGAWSVCDTAAIRDDVPNPPARPVLTTTVVVGPRFGDPLGTNEALLVAEPSTGATYLVWDGRRLRVDLTDRAVTLAYHLDGIVPREVSTGLLNAIPEGVALAPPTIPDAGAPAPFPGLAGVQVGDVVRVAVAGEPDSFSFFLVLRHGTQQVPPPVANLIRFAGSSGQHFKTVAQSVIADTPRVAHQQFDEFPARVPAIRPVTDTPVVCLVWPPRAPRPTLTVSADAALLGDKGVEVPEAAADEADRVLLELGSGALVRGWVPNQPAGTGQIWLVTDRGLRYGVPSVEVAEALGFENVVPAAAPEPLLRLLKSGPALDPRQVLALFESG